MKLAEIAKVLLESLEDLNIHSQFIGDLKKELSKFKSSEDLLRGGGLSIELLDRLAHGFSEEDITQLKPKDLKIRWRDDLENVKHEIQKSGIPPKEWAREVNLSEPIEVSYRKSSGNKNQFFIEDGHHRYFAAKILNKPLNVSVKIEVNPITTISKDLGYDELHRLLYDRFSKNTREVSEIFKETLNEGYVFHGTGKGQALNIQKDGFMKPNRTGEDAPSVSFSDNLEYAKYYARMKGGSSKMCILRTRLTKDFKLSARIKNNKGVEYITFRKIPSSDLEVLTNKEDWKPLDEWDVIFDEPLQ